jgi:hypothetical protein
VLLCILGFFFLVFAQKECHLHIDVSDSVLRLSRAFATRHAFKKKKEKENKVLMRKAQRERRLEGMRQGAFKTRDALSFTGAGWKWEKEMCTLSERCIA